MGNKWYRKAIWLMLFPFFQVTRPPRLKAIKMWDRWFSLNLGCAIAYDVAIIYFCGWAGFLYLVFAFLFSIGNWPRAPPILRTRLPKARLREASAFSVSTRRMGKKFGSMNMIVLTGSATRPAPV